MASKKQKKEPEPVPERRIISGDQALARTYGVSTKTVQNWRGVGLPSIDRGNGFDYDLNETDPWVAAYRTEGDGDEETGSLNKQIKEAKLRIELAEADRLEREEEQARGNILPRDEYELFATETIQNARDQLLRIPRLMKSHLCSKCHKKLQELEKQIKTALEQLSKLPTGPDKE